MKKPFLILCLLSLLLPSVANATEVDYKKFGRIATVVVKEDYPGQSVKDYLYLGRKQLTNEKVSDTFEFTVQENNRDKRVLIIIVHDLANEKTLNITVHE
ncbi:DUF3889 domain-containing protein [Rossellomorea marisflavi]|uniref:DUF3889 domain-containing protein n=1 Tax=Rossellomorea marisflavi TaxID=189381 RepID=A0A0M0GSV9_9BACI|nr:DUF3889 domain-containing protein [Rossellomorea marisflavi]KON92506.1 hypothetical protein AF331_08725 [Rossellomorea marisflavi]MCM2591965.1 YqzG/YhdC family protein [Rossellomorea marisflavi]